MQNSSQIWDVQAFLEQLKGQLHGFDYRINYDQQMRRPIGIVWITKPMKTCLLWYGHLISLDFQKQKYNILSWPYCGPVIIDGDMEIGVFAEALHLSESLDGYMFVMESAFDMVPKFD